MIVINELVSADIYCNDDEAYAIQDAFDQVAKGPATFNLYRELTAPEQLRNRVTIRRLEARYFYKILESMKDYLYE